MRARRQKTPDRRGPRARSRARAAGRLGLLDLPTYIPWLNPIEMRWRHYRREVTHCELFTSLEALLKAAPAFFDRGNQSTERVLSIIGAHAA
jgi:hypothetical protein